MSHNTPKPSSAQLGLLRDILDVLGIKEIPNFNSVVSDKYACESFINSHKKAYLEMKSKKSHSNEAYLEKNDSNGYINKAEKIDGTNITYNELQKALKERELKKLVEQAEKEMVERKVSADELISEMKQRQEAKLQTKKKEQEAEKRRQEAEKTRQAELEFKEKMKHMDKECRTILPFIDGEEYYKIGNNYWNTKKFTIEEAYKCSKTLVACEFCIDCCDSAFCDYCVNCISCNNCHYCANSIGCYFSYMLQRCKYCSFCRILTSCDGCMFCMLCTFCSRCKNCYDETYTFYKMETFYPLLFTIDNFYGTKYIYPLDENSDDTRKRRHLFLDELSLTDFIKEAKTMTFNSCS